MTFKHIFFLALFFSSQSTTLENFDKDYVGFSFGISKLNFVQENTQALFPRDQSHNIFNWGHFFTDSTAYDISYFQNQDTKSNVSLTSGSKFLGITLGSDLTLQSLTRTRQISLRIRQLYPFKKTPQGVFNLEGSLGYSQVWMKNHFSNVEGSTALTPFSLRHSAMCPHIGAGLVYIPYHSAVQFTAHYHFDAYSKLGTTVKEITDGSAGVLGNAQLKPNDSHGLKIGLEYCY